MNQLIASKLSYAAREREREVAEEKKLARINRKKKAARLKAKEAKQTSNNKRMAAALWKELKRRQGNGAVPLRIDWIAVTEKRLNAAVAALRHS